MPTISPDFILGLIILTFLIIARTDAGHWILVAGLWLLASGYWSLVSGRWLLVTGRWFPVAGGIVAVTT